MDIETILQVLSSTLNSNRDLAINADNLEIIRRALEAREALDAEPQQAYQPTARRLIDMAANDYFGVTTQGSETELACSLIGIDYSGDRPVAHAFVLNGLRYERFDVETMRGLDDKSLIINCTVQPPAGIDGTNYNALLNFFDEQIENAV
jgi:hypothetical protein